MPGPSITALVEVDYLFLLAGQRCNYLERVIRILSIIAQAGIFIRLATSNNFLPRRRRELLAVCSRGADAVDTILKVERGDGLPARSQSAWHESTSVPCGGLALPWRAVTGASKTQLAGFAGGIAHLQRCTLGLSFHS